MRRSFNNILWKWVPQVNYAYFKNYFHLSSRNVLPFQFRAPSLLLSHGSWWSWCTASLKASLSMTLRRPITNSLALMSWPNPLSMFRFQREPPTTTTLNITGAPAAHNIAPPSPTDSPALNTLFLGTYAAAQDGCGWGGHDLCLRKAGQEEDRRWQNSNCCQNWGGWERGHSERCVLFGGARHLLPSSA